MNYWYLKLSGRFLISDTMVIEWAASGVNESNFKLVLKLLSANPSFFRGLDLSWNPLFKETSLKTLFWLNKTPTMLERSIDKLNTRYLTFISLEKTGIASESVLWSFVTNVFYTWPDLEILILNSLPITDKICLALSSSLQSAAHSQMRLTRNFKEIGLSNTKVTDKSVIKLLLVIMKFSFLEVINLEWNPKIGFRTASFILHQLCKAGSQGKIALREVFLEYTKVSSSLRNSLDLALHSYQNGNLTTLSKISNKYNNSSSHRSQPRQNSSRYAFANDFRILNDKDTEVMDSQRSKSIPKVSEKQLKDINIRVKDLADIADDSVLLDVSWEVPQPSKKINFKQNNYLFKNRPSHLSSK